MKIQLKTPSHRRNAALAFGAIALLSVSLTAAPARAQDAGAPADNGKPISLNLINVPVQTALRTLFSSAGIRNYTIAPDVQGYANVNVSDVPFSLALRQLLNSGNPPLTFSIDNGIYNIKVQAAPTAPTVTVAPTNPDSATASADGPKRFYSIPIDSYDAYYIATLVGQTGIIQVQPNYAPNDSGTGGAQGGQAGGRGGIGGGIGGGQSLGITTVGGGTGGFGGGFGGGGGGRRGY